MRTQYLAICETNEPPYDWQRYNTRVRPFTSLIKAKWWVEQRHAEQYRQCVGLEPYAGDYLERAFIYEVFNDGALIPLLEFDGLDRGDGACGGWSEIKPQSKAA